MRILAIDTATWRASVALVAGPDTSVVRCRTTRGEHTAHVLPMIQEVLGEARCEVRSLDAIAVSAGPGSFTGLRVGLSLAKSIAFAVDLPVLPVPTLQALALAAPVESGTVAAVLDARRGEVYAGLFERQGEQCFPLGGEWLLSPGSLLARLPRPVAIIGDACDRYGAEWERELGTQARMVPFPEDGACAVAVARLALQHGQAHPPEHLEPRYVRASEAEETFRKKLKKLREGQRQLV